jgi:hypothetical protein
LVVLHLLRLAAAGSALAAGIAFAGPAHAAVRYDRTTHTGFVDRADMREAFGWTDAVLADRAAGISAGYALNILEIYSVTCGERAFRWTHNLQHTTNDLIATATYERAELTGFRLAPGHGGASSMRMPPRLGDDCSTELGQPAGTTVGGICFVSSSTSWGIVVRFEDTHRVVGGDEKPTPPRLASSAEYFPPACRAPAGQRGRTPAA